MDWLNLLKNFAISSVGTYAVTLIIGIIISYLKKGQFKEWGIIVGKWVNKIGDARFGQKRWETMEDALTVSFVSFAVGVKEGADYDDGEVKTLMDDKTKVGNLPYEGRINSIKNNEVK